MSPRARRFFGCVLPVAFLLGACGVFAMLVYSAQAIVHVDEVRDASMAPLLRPGMSVLTNNTAFWYEDPYRPAIVTVGRPEGRVLRRIVGLPGETVEIRDGRVLADGQGVWRLADDLAFPDAGPIDLGPEQYFLLAAQPDAPDSRTWGPVPRAKVYGVATFFRRSARDGWRALDTDPTPEP